jgi:hypothetical protein
MINKKHHNEMMLFIYANIMDAEVKEDEVVMVDVEVIAHALDVAANVVVCVCDVCAAYGISFENYLLLPGLQANLQPSYLLRPQ